ncbi:MAG: hypothetical protein KKC51_04690 [Verrucomicrobia bacterium]|nr:hypothetical protein [Verrucomicrobiota bacterium]
MKRLFLAVVSVILSVLGGAFAQYPISEPPEFINYQGRLLDGDTLVNGEETIVFRLFDSEEDGNEVFAETQTVTVVDGLYSVRVGSHSPTGALVNALASSPLYLEIEIDETPLSPRERIGSVAFALNALDRSSISFETGESFVIVQTTSNDVENGQNLLAAYAVASALEPNGLPRSADNRVTVLVPPGRYDLQATTLALIEEFVDVVGLSPARDDQYITGTSEGSGSGVLLQTADDVRIENLFVECARGGGDVYNNSMDPAAYFPDGGLSNTVVRNCRFKEDTEGGAWSTRLGTDYAGTYENCVAGLYAFGGWLGRASGTFRDCRAENGSFAGAGGEASGLFERCTGGPASFAGLGGVASGTFRDCVGDFNSFGVSGTADGFFFNCWLKGTHWGNFELAGRLEGCRWDAPVTTVNSGIVFRSIVDGVFRNDSKYEGLSAIAYERGDAFVIVETTTNEFANGQNLLAAYAAVTNLTPHGQELGMDNRAAVLVPPGRYNLGTGQLTLSAEYVDLVGLSSARSDQHILGDSDGFGTGVLGQTADDVRIENLVIECTRAGGYAGDTSNSPSAYFPNSGLSNTVVRNCEFRSDGVNAWSMRIYIEYAGTYENCLAGKRSFGGYHGVASGTFRDCEAGDESFAYYYNCEASGVFDRCRAGNNSFGSRGVASGRFTDCVAGYSSFGGDNGEATGTFSRCTAGHWSFGGGSIGDGKASGRFADCTAGNFSFGGRGSEASGEFIHCIAGDNSFGGGDGPVASGYFQGCYGGDGCFGFEGVASGVFIDCVGGHMSFGGVDDPGSMNVSSGTFYNCWLNSESWNGGLAGKMVGCRWAGDVYILDGAQIYDSTIAGWLIGWGVGTCKVAHVRAQNIVWSNMVNAIFLPYNVEDLDVE